jgi:hypothetical protein
MGEDNYTCEELAAILPERWREKAGKPGALPRAREIKTPEDFAETHFPVFDRRKILWEHRCVVSYERELSSDQEGSVYANV